MDEKVFPVASLDAALPELRRPFAAEAVKWKVQSEWATKPAAAGGPGGLVIAYFDVRLVVERLNLVVGAGWSDAYRIHASGVEECALTVFGVTRSDVGVGAGPQAAKSMRSDALKRAGVKFGVGISVYAMGRAMLDARAQPETHELTLAKRWDKKLQKEVPTVEIGSALAGWLAEKYARWVEAKAEATFGAMLPHGDEPDAAGMDDDPGERVVEEAAPVEEAGPQVQDEVADGLRARAREAYQAMRDMNPRAKPPAVFRQELEEAGASHEALGEYVDTLEAAVATMREARG